MLLVMVRFPDEIARLHRVRQPGSAHQVHVQQLGRAAEPGEICPQLTKREQGGN
jgi:hypothetical protein